MASCLQLLRLERPDCSNPADAAEPCCSGSPQSLAREALCSAPWFDSIDPGQQSSFMAVVAIGLQVVHGTPLLCVSPMHGGARSLRHMCIPQSSDPAAYCVGGNFGARFGYLSVVPDGLLALWSLSAGAAAGRTPLYNCTGPLSGAQPYPPPPLARQPPPLPRLRPPASPSVVRASPPRPPRAIPSPPPLKRPPSPPPAPPSAPPSQALVSPKSPPPVVRPGLVMASAT